MTTDGNNARPRRRQAAKASGPQDAQRVKLTLYLPVELAKRFGVHAEMMDLDKSELFAEMVRTHCRRFVVHDHGKETGGDLGEAGEWLVRREGSELIVEHGHGKGDVALRGPAGRLLLVLLRRIPPGDPQVEVIGDPAVLAGWLAHSPY